MINNEQLYSLITKEILPEQVLLNEPMKKHTSFRIGGNADIFVKVKNIEELKTAIRIAKKQEIHLTIIGNGSNLLVKDNGIRGIVVKIEFDKIEIKKEPLGKDYIITVGAGVKLGQLAQILLKEEITGFEFAAGIPGTIGGAIRMNAGAYGGEMKDIVIETKCLNIEEYEKNMTKTNIDDIEIIYDNQTKKQPEIMTLDSSQQQFSYRHSIFAEKQYIVLETKLKLQKGNAQEIKSKMEEYNNSRKEKQPIAYPSAGSTFKRGEDYITAKIIDECGLKGYSIGDAQVSDLHAGFIINKGNATAKDVLKLIKHIQDTVYQKTGKKIELEVEILGE